MINFVRIKNFKSHKDTVIKLSNLTLLCGQNGVGKSSFIQSLLLLRQTHFKNRLTEVLDLNAPLVYIGKTKDVLYQFPDREEGDEIAIVLADSENEYSWIFDSARNESSFLPRINDTSDSEGYESLALFNNNFHYLSAGRLAQYETDDYAVEIQRQISISEGKGELVAQFLYKYGKSLKVHESLIHKNEPDPFLLNQVTAWEREISKGVNIKPKSIGDAYEIRYSFSNDQFGETDDFSSKNVGFGLSYSLPVIVAILSSQPGDLLLIENPEAHLHQNGQSKLAELISLAAETGIQIIVETHSDHIVNGVLIQTKKADSSEKGINKKNLKIYYLDRDEQSHATTIIDIEVLGGGRLKNRPAGFFDQMSKDLRSLI